MQAMAQELSHSLHFFACCRMFTPWRAFYSGIRVWSKYRQIGGARLRMFKSGIGESKYGICTCFIGIMARLCFNCKNRKIVHFFFALFFLGISYFIAMAECLSIGQVLDALRLLLFRS